MTKISDLNDKKRRLEFLTAEQNGVNSLLADNNIVASKLASIVVENKPKDAKSLVNTITKLDDEIEGHRPLLLNQTESQIGNIIQLSITHKIGELNDDRVAIDTSRYMTIQDEIASRYYKDKYPQFIDGIPLNYSEQEKLMIAKTSDRILDAVQDEIEILISREKTPEGLAYMRHLSDKYSDQLGGAVSLPLRVYESDLLAKLGITAEELNARINTLNITSKPTTLSDRLWTSEEKRSVYETVARGIKENKSSFQIADDLEKVVINGRPRSTLDRIANTELVRAYSKTKQYIMEDIVNTHPEYKVIVEIRLNALHPKPDICDLVEGDYDLENAPIVPIHPHCICIRRERLVSKDYKIKTTTIKQAIASKSKYAERNKIYIPKVVGEQILT